MDYKISVLTDHSRIDEIIRLFSTGLGTTSHEHWIWRLFTPNGMRQPEAIIAETESGRIVGMASILFEEYGNHDYKAIQFCDWVVDPEYRGQGIIGKIYRYALAKYEADGYDFIIEYPNDNSYPIFQKYGFTELENIGSWNTANHIVFHTIKLQNKNIGSAEYQFFDKCPLNDSDFIQKKGRIYRCHEYMTWKYDQNPDVDFKWLTVRKHERLIGYFVFTVTHGRIRKVINVYDWEFDNEQSDEFVIAIKLLNKLGNSVSIWGRYQPDEIALMESASMTHSTGGTRLILKAISNKGYPDKLTLTRIDTDY